MELSQVLSWIGFISGLLIGVPQVVKTIKTRSAGDLSATTFCCVCFATIKVLPGQFRAFQIRFGEFSPFQIGFG